MVLDNLTRGHADEEIKRKVLATAKTDCTLAKVLWFVEAEESAKYSLSDSKLFKSVSGYPHSRGSSRKGAWSGSPWVTQPRPSPSSATTTDKPK